MGFSIRYFDKRTITYVEFLLNHTNEAYEQLNHTTFLRHGREDIILDNIVVGRFGVG